MPQKLARPVTGKFAVMTFNGERLLKPLEDGTSWIVNRLINNYQSFIRASLREDRFGKYSGLIVSVTRSITASCIVNIPSHSCCMLRYNKHNHFLGSYDVWRHNATIHTSLCDVIFFETT